jgi:hypothetical protein
VCGLLLDLKSSVQRHHQQRSLPQALQLKVQIIGMQMLQQQKMQMRHLSSLTLLDKVCVQKLGTLLLHNNVMMSAKSFLELDGEYEVRAG